MMRTLGLGTAVAGMVFSLTACVVPNPPATERAGVSNATVTTTVAMSEDVNLIRDTSLATDTMMNNVRIVLPEPKRVLVMPLTVLNDRDTSDFGRMSAEMIGNRLAQMGYATISSSEVISSRDMAKAVAAQNVQAVVGGSYLITGMGDMQTVVVSIRMTSVEDGALIAASNYEMPIGPRLRSMLR